MSLVVAVADPDPVTRSEMTRALAQAEFTVLEAGDGVHALPYAPALAAGAVYALIASGTVLG